MTKYFVIKVEKMKHYENKVKILGLNNQIWVKIKFIMFNSA